MNQDDELQCVICREDAKYFSIYQCSHYQNCLYCSLKLRMLYNDNKCPICKIESKMVIIYSIDDPITSFGQADLNSCYKSTNFEADGLMVSDISAFEEIEKLTAFKCQIPFCNEPVFKTYNSLETHLNKAHKRYFCKVCVKDGKRFMSQATIFTFDELKNHRLLGEYDEHWNNIVPIHHECQFCLTSVYDEEAYVKHMREFHYECTMCKSVGKKLIFYKDMTKIFVHNKYNHYQCPYAECKNDYFIAFDSKQKAIDHMVEKHKCRNPSEMLDKYLLDSKDPFNCDKEADMFDAGVNIEEYVNSLKEMVASNSKYCRENKAVNQIVQNNQKQKEKKERHNNKQGYITKETEKNGITYIQKIQISETQKAEKQKGNNETGPNKIKVPEKPILKIADYTSHFLKYYSEMKSFITSKIKNENINENTVKITHTVYYQLIVIIHKLDFKEMGELNYINNFGFGFSMVYQILNCFASPSTYSFYDNLLEIQFDKLLILYKYLHICYLKASGAFYKKDEEDIEEDIYDEFIPREKDKKPEKIKSGIQYSTNTTKPSKYELNKRKEKAKIVVPEKKVVPPSQPQPSVSCVVKPESKGKLGGLLSKQDTEANEDYFNDGTENQANSKSKLGKLLDNKASSVVTPVAVKKSGAASKKKFKGITEDDFPELK